MKTRIIIGFCLFLGFGFFLTNFVFARETTSVFSDIQEVIEQLQEQVELLQIRIAELKDEPDIATQTSTTTPPIVTLTSAATSSEPTIPAEPLVGTGGAITVPQVTPSSAVADQELLDPILPPWITEGIGMHFEINNSPFLDLTVDSSESIQLQIESMPEMIIMIVESVSSAASTHISIKTLEPLTTYYKYEDGYQNGTTIDTDSEGALAFVQDLSVPHIVFIQKNKGTKFIKDDLTGGDCTTIGTWDVTTKTCTLTTDIFETIQIDDNNVTLDGNDRSIIGGDGVNFFAGIGVFLVGKTDVTVKDLNVRGFNSGIRLYNSNFNSLIGNSLRANLTGISISGSSNNDVIKDNVSDNSASSGEIGISLLRGTSGNTLENNITSNGRNGIVLNRSNNNKLTNNTANSNSRSGISLSASRNNILIDNIVQENGENDFNISASQSLDCVNTIQGILGSGNRAFKYFNSAVDLNNEIFSGLVLCDADGSNISGIVVVGSDTEKNNGISFHFTDDSTVENVISSDNRQGISLFNSTNNSINNSTFADNALRGIFIVSRSSSNKIFNNNFINNAISPFVQTRSESVFSLPLPVGGNHWSRFNSPAEGCFDSDSNDICDTSFVFSGGQDKFPFVNKDGWKVPPAPPKMINPTVTGTIKSDFRSLERSGHNGIDINKDIEGDDVIAVAGGTILCVDDIDNSNAGKWAWIEHRDITRRDGTVATNVSSRYLHLDSLVLIPADIGRSIAQGDKIGVVNKTGLDTNKDPEAGSHLHFELRKDAPLPPCPNPLILEALNPLDFVDYDLATTTLSINTASPVDVKVVDPDGLVISKEVNQLPNVATYFQTTYKAVDEGEGSTESYDTVTIEKKKEGDYKIEIISEAGASLNDTYSLSATIGTTTVILGKDVRLEDIPDQPYIARSSGEEVKKVILTNLRIKPETLNLTRKGIFTAFIQISKGLGATVQDINPETITVSGASAVKTTIDEETNTLIVKFDTQELVNTSISEEVELTLRGGLFDGTLLEGSDTIRVISKGVSVKLSALLANLSEALSYLSELLQKP